MNKLLHRINNNYKIIEIVSYTFIFLLSLRIIYKQILFGPDYKIHIDIINQFLYHKFYIPHPGFHIIIHILSKITALPYNQITTIFMALVIVVTIKITEIILNTTPKITENRVLILFVAIAINITIAMYAPFFSIYMYLGQWSPTIWHSPTFSLLKPFALWGFFSLLFIINDNKKSTTQYLFLTSIILALGSLIKPSFIICLIPAVSLYLLFFRWKQLKLYFKIAIVFLPSILFLLFQFFETYRIKETSSYFHDKIIFTWFGVMKTYSTNLFVSFILVIGFPLCVLLFNYKKIKGNTQLLLSWILVIVSYLISGFLAEQEKFKLGAFIFSFEICLFILYVFSLIEFLRWFNDIKQNKIKIFITTIIFSYHLISGLIYLFGILKYGSCIYVQ